MNKRWMMLAASAVALTAQARAQEMPESYRAVQMAALDLQRHTLLAMADSMPERLYRDKVTPIQRDFAQQLGHVAGSMVYIVGQFIGAPAPNLPDTSVAFNSRAGMRSYINTSYDWATGVLRNETAADRATTVPFFGQPKPKWQVWDELHQHTFWTLGQVVANFRKNGMAPPGFGFF